MHAGESRKLKAILTQWAEKVTKAGPISKMGIKIENILYFKIRIFQIFALKIGPLNSARGLNREKKFLNLSKVVHIRI
jgi:hypothetical protein